MYTGCIGTAGQIEPAFAHLRAKIPKRNASLRKSLRSILYQALGGRPVYIAQTPRWAFSSQYGLREIWAPGRKEPITLPEPEAIEPSPCETDSQ